MEVHVPAHPVTSWREFFTHIAIVSVGLLIALSLESLVEWHHHRSLVHEARDNLQQEITENRAQLQQNLTDVRADMTRMTKNLQVLAALRTTGKVPDNERLQYSLDWSRLSDTAWTTSRDTGALGFMDYGEVQCFAGIYAQQQIINTQAMDLFQRQSQAISPVFISGSPDGMTVEERERVLQRSADLLAELKGLEQIMTQWNTQCASKG